MKLLSKIIYLLIPFIFLSGCFTMSPEESRKLYFNMPEQKLCVDYINYPSYNYYQPYRAEAISNRKIDCNKYLGIASAKAQQDREFDAAVQDVIKGIEKIETGKMSGKGTDSDFEDWVKEELENLGYDVIPQVGVSGFFIDLGIKHKDYPFGYLAGVECDGATYHSSLSARDNDITRQKVLENYGWNIYRIWSTNWFNDSKTELKKLDSYLKSIIKNKLN